MNINRLNRKEQSHVIIHKSVFNQILLRKLQKRKIGILNEQLSTCNSGYQYIKII